jgi:hypothetical protein
VVRCQGNPDADKVGAFGVGFYSVFALGEEPRIRSGGRVTSLYWEGKMLRYKTRPEVPGEKGASPALVTPRLP